MSQNKDKLDKFYTNIDTSKKCIGIVSNLYDWNTWDLVIEPSAGNGSFLLNIPIQHKIGIDIAPENETIIKQDFLTYLPPCDKAKILVIGNPPFGKISSLAIKFFNHSSQWCDVIAFILPRTFRRISVQNKLNTYFHLVYDEELPTNPCCFNPPMMAKCCFQVWEKRDCARELIQLDTTHNDWEFMGLGAKDDKGQPTPPIGADFAIRAYGGKCGEIIAVGLEKLRPKSWHWIKSYIDKNELMNRFLQLDFSLSENTSRQNSIGRGELVKIYSDYYD